MELIGLTGYAQHGKDSTAKFLEPYGYKQYAFADALKQMALVLDPIVSTSKDWPPGHYYPGLVRLSSLIEKSGWEEAKKLPEVRRFLQVLGTEAVRDILGENSWVDALGNKLGTDRPKKAVITDVRFPNEAEFVRRQGGKLWLIQRPGFDNGIGTDHPSEAFISTLPVDLQVSATNLEVLEDIVRREMESA
jgi:hypothetical protein